jgi:hypothetical protein
MKIYICRRGRPDFVCHADTVGDAIVMLWMTTKETPRASYRVHFGRRRQAKTISAAVAYWRLSARLRGPLYDVLEETATDSQFTEFCDIAVQAGSLLGK